MCINQLVGISVTLTVNSDTRSGIAMDRGHGNNTISIEGGESNDNSMYGFYLSGESTRILDSTADGNGERELYLRDIDRKEPVIRNSF